MRHSLTERARTVIYHLNQLTKPGRVRNRQGKTLALAGYRAKPVMWDLFVQAHPLTAWSWGLARRPFTR